MSLQQTPVIQQIEDAVRSVPGWSPVDQLFALFNLAYASAPLGGDLLELGSWCGRSAVALGMAAKHCGTGSVHCVDLFPEKDDWYRNDDGSYSFRVVIDGETISSYHQQTVWEEPFERDIAPLYEENGGLFARFSQTMRANQLQSVVNPFRGDLGRFFARHPDIKLRLAFLDGHHSYDAVCQDIENVLPHLSPSGWICFDDAFTSYDGVNQAIGDCIIANPQFVDAQQMTRKLFVARRRS